MIGSRPVLLALFCGAGGAGRGYRDAGFEVVGVDSQKRHRKAYEANVGEFHCGDALAFLASYAGRVDAVHMSPPCFIAGTPVLTKRGSVSIEEVQVGDLVWTHESRWRPVIKTMSRQSEVVKVGPITCTPDHPFYTRSQYYYWNNQKRRRVWKLSEPGWTPAAMTQGEFLSSPTAVRLDDGHDWIVDPWLAGRYVADGL